MNQKLRDFRDLIASLYPLGRVYLTQHTAVTFSAPCASITWFDNKKTIEKCFVQEEGQLGDFLIPLEAPSGHTGKLVGMWCKWDFTNVGSFSCQIEILIYSASNQIYGFRIDPPHKNFEKHNYWHSQFTHQFSNNAGFPTSQAINWISASTPAYPIELINQDEFFPVDAVTYALIALYGKDIPKQTLRTIKSITLNTSLRRFIATVNE